MQNITSNWNFMRLLRLAFGIIIIAQGIQLKEYALATLGGLFSLMALLNIGCCSSASCKNIALKSDKKIKDITYEEVG